MSASNAANELDVDTAAREFVITRQFDAPRDVVFRAWTESERLMQWWGPKGFTVTRAKLDLRPGGTFHYSMRAPDGSEMWGRWVLREISAPERIVFVNSFSDPDGGLAPVPDAPEWPIEFLTTVTFTEFEGRTSVTVRQSPINPTALERETFESNSDSMQGGWNGTMEQLVKYLG
jgi:uncharacterized protein YndB with AHSA1/START domain